MPFRGSKLLSEVSHRTAEFSRSISNLTTFCRLWEDLNSPLLILRLIVSITNNIVVDGCNGIEMRLLQSVLGIFKRLWNLKFQATEKERDMF